MATFTGTLGTTTSGLGSLALGAIPSATTAFEEEGFQAVVCADVIVTVATASSEEAFVARTSIEDSVWTTRVDFAPTSSFAGAEEIVRNTQDEDGFSSALRVEIMTLSSSTPQEETIDSKPLEEVASSLWRMPEAPILVSFVDDEVFVRGRAFEEQSVSAIIAVDMVISQTFAGEETAGNRPSEEPGVWAFTRDSVWITSFSTDEEFAGSISLEEQSVWVVPYIATSIASFVSDDEFFRGTAIEDDGVSAAIFDDAPFPRSVAPDEELVGGLTFEDESVSVAPVFGTVSSQPAIDEEFANALRVEDDGVSAKPVDDTTRTGIVAPDEEFANSFFAEEPGVSTTLRLLDDRPPTASYEEAPAHFFVEEEPGWSRSLLPPLFLRGFYYDEEFPRKKPPPPPPPPVPPVPPAPPRPRGGGGGGFAPWSITSDACYERRLKDLLEEAFVEPALTAAIEVWRPRPEVEEPTIIIVEPKVRTSEAIVPAPKPKETIVVIEAKQETQTIYVPVPVAVPYVPRWVGWTFIAVGSVMVVSSVNKLLSERKPVKRRRRRKRKRR